MIGEKPSPPTPHPVSEHGGSPEVFQTKTGEGNDVVDVERSLEKDQDSLKPLDIVLFNAGALSYYVHPGYMQIHPGATRDSTLWRTDNGIRVSDTDAWGWDRPVDAVVHEPEPGVNGKVREAIQGLEDAVNL